MAKVNHFLEMWQGSWIIRATQRESGAQKKQMTAVRYISDTEEIVNASWPNLQHDGAAVFKLSERSPQPPAMSAEDLLGRRTQIFNLGWIQNIDCHRAEGNEESAPVSISDAEYLLDWNGGWDNPNVTEDYCETDDESDSNHNNVSEYPQTAVQWDVNGAPNGPVLIRQSWRSNKTAAKVILTFSATETWRNNGNKKQ
jgi:hypothetical protein